MAASRSMQPVSPVKRKRKIIEGGETMDTKRKRVDGDSKKPKVNEVKVAASGKFGKSKSDAKIEKPLDRKGRKELAEYRKKKRKPNYDLEKEVKTLWEKMRQRNLEKEERTKLVSETLKKMRGKLVEMAGSHIASRVLQACVKYCQQAERDAVFQELRPHALALARNTYAYHLVIKMLDHANKSQLQQLLSTLHGHVVALLRHPVGSAVIEHAYQVANGAQKRELVCEFYSPEYRLFKGVTDGKCGLPDLLAKESVTKQNAMLQHMMLGLQPILEKGIVDHSITHRALVEYLNVCKKTMVEDVVKSLASPLLVRMIHTKDGAKVGVTCVKLSTAKERKSIIRGMKGHVSKIAQDEYSSIVLVALLDVVDDTKLISKIITSELMKDLKDLASHKYGRRCILHLLAPGVPRYFPSDVRAALQYSTCANLQDEATNTSMTVKGTEKVPPAEKTKLKISQDNDKSEVGEENANEGEIDSDNNEGKDIRGISKKDPSVRRFELLSAGGLGKKLAEICIEQANELLQSPIGTELVYEVAMGGIGGVMWEVALDEVQSLHTTIADLAAKPPRTGDRSQVETEHVLEQYHSSRTIRRLIINSESCPKPGIVAPSFSAALWATALKSKCKLWAEGHSAKVISAYKICKDESVKEAAATEVQGLIDSGLIKQS